jgi:rod shape-determining protein MreC
MPTKLAQLSKNKTYWYLAGCWILSVLLLTLPSSQKMLVSSVMWEFLYSPFYQASEKIRSLYNVHQENRQLKLQIAELKIQASMLFEQRVENERLRRYLNLRNQSGLEVIPCEVVAREPHFRLTSLVVSAGSNSGVSKNMPVIDEHGLVGKIIEVFSDRSVVQSVYDPGLEISAVDQRSRIKGIASWKSGAVMELKYVSAVDDVQIGDPIVTSGLGSIYPAGIEIGTVTAVTKNESMLFKEIDIQTRADIRNSEELFIIKSYNR